MSNVINFAERKFAHLKPVGFDWVEKADPTPTAEEIQDAINTLKAGELRLSQFADECEAMVARIDAALNGRPSP